MRASSPYKAQRRALTGGSMVEIPPLHTHTHTLSSLGNDLYKALSAQEILTLLAQDSTFEGEQGSQTQVSH